MTERLSKVKLIQAGTLPLLSNGYRDSKPVVRNIIRVYFGDPPVDLRHECGKQLDFERPFTAAADFVFTARFTTSANAPGDRRAQLRPVTFDENQHP